jgi:uncharacterized protein (TIRG00374 family)
VNGRLLRPLLLSVLCGVLGLGAVLVFGKPSDLLVIRQLSVQTLLICAQLMLLSFVCGGLRIRSLTRSLGYRLRFWSAVRSHILGLFSAAITPSGSGNAPAIALMLVRDGVSRTHAWSVALYTGIVDLLFFAWGVPASLLVLKLTGHLPRVRWLIIAGIVVSVLFLLLWYLIAFHLSALPRLIIRLFSWRPLRPFRSRATTFSRKLSGTVLRLSRRTRLETLYLQALSVGTHLSIFAMVPVIATNLELSLSPLPTVATLFLVYIVSHVVPTPGGSGFLELTLPLLLAPEQPARAAPLVLVWRVLSFYSVFILGPALGGTALAKQLEAKSPTPSEP